MDTQALQRLMGQMTQEEKVAQLTQYPAAAYDAGQTAITGPDAKPLSAKQLAMVGSILGKADAGTLRRLQTEHLANDRLKIPLLFMFDMIHGLETIYPIPLALGATFDPKLVEKLSAGAALEAVHAGVHVTFAPMADLVRDPRWGRVMESTGEDSYLNAKMAAAQVRGFQGSDDGTVAEGHIAACVKHFAAYGGAEAGREYNTVDISEWRLREQFLPAYQAAIDAKVRLVMTSFNVLFGVPVSANPYLVTKMLREQMGFNGVTISDWRAIAELMVHGVAENGQEAATQALEAGIDMDMVDGLYAAKLSDTDDPKLQAAIDAACWRLLELKNSLGLFEDPFRGVSAPLDHEQRTMLEADAYQAAVESMVLLKNQGDVLPLAPDTRVALVGPVAATGDLLGSWAANGAISATETIAHAMADKVVGVAAGSDYFNGTQAQRDAAVALTADSDVIVAAIGLPGEVSGEAASLADPSLPQAQVALLEALHATGKPVVAVLITGRPLVLTQAMPFVDGLLCAWFPGTSGAAAIKAVLFGSAEPSGRLPMTFPRAVGQIPIYYDHYQTGRPKRGVETRYERHYTSSYMDEDNAPLFTFGAGHGYGDVYATYTLTQATVTPNKPLAVSVTLVNHSPRPTTAVVQAYIHQLVGKTVRPVRALKAFTRVPLAAGAVQKVVLTIPYDRLASVHPDLTTATDAGAYQLLVGLAPEALTTLGFTVAK